MTVPVALAFPGSLDTPTGGYAYDREVLRHLGDHGIAAAPLELPAGFPLPTPDMAQDALARLSRTADGTLLLVDGLALGALPTEGLRPLAHRLVALIHHPLALEAGLAPDQRAALAASERAALALCRAVVTTSRATARTLIGDYGVPEPRIRVAEPGVAAAPRAPCDGPVPRLLAVGSVIPRKAYGVLIAALAGVRDLNWTLTVIGSLDLDPGESARVRASIAEHGLSDRITLRGAVSRADLDAAYLASDLFVHPALYEGYGMVLAEALRRGLPLVCTTGGAAAETVPDGAGVKVPPGQADALGAALRPLLSDAVQRRALADAAFRAGSALPTWSQTAAIIADILTLTHTEQMAA